MREVTLARCNQCGRYYEADTKHKCIVSNNRKLKKVSAAEIHAEIKKKSDNPYQE